MMYQKTVREERKKLRERHLEDIRTREDVEFAFIPWTVPACILYKCIGTSKLKSFSLPISDKKMETTSINMEGQDMDRLVKNFYVISQVAKVNG